jgi:hypothetical protein
MVSDKWRSRTVTDFLVLTSRVPTTLTRRPWGWDRTKGIFSDILDAEDIRVPLVPFGSAGQFKIAYQARGMKGL